MIQRYVIENQKFESYGCGKIDPLDKNGKVLILDFFTFGIHYFVQDNFLGLKSIFDLHFHCLNR